jgi:hypothetical protein
MSTFARFIDRTLDTAATPLAYLVVAQSVIFGLAFAVFDEETSVNKTILYPYGIWFGVSLWGWAIVVAASMALVGLFYKTRLLVEPSSFVLFGAWLFATIAYLQNDAWFQAALAAFNILYAGYLFLSSNLGRLWCYTPGPR